MRRNIALSTVMLIGLLMTCLTPVRQSKVSVHDVGKLKIETQDARLKAKVENIRSIGNTNLYTPKGAIIKYINSN